MDCRDFRKIILPFFKEELDEKAVKKVLTHIESCPDCKEEMNVQYLVWEGRRRLSQGGNFDLQADYKNMLEKAKEKSETIAKLQRAVNAVMGLGIVTILFFLLRGFFI